MTHTLSGERTLIRTGQNHPIVTLLAQHPEWEFHLIGSRRYGRDRAHRSTDWDFIVDGSIKEVKPDGTPTYSRMHSAIGQWLEENGFEQVHRGGYSVDRHVYHYRWKDKPQPGPSANWLPHVDVLVTQYEGSLERRLHIYEECSSRLMKTLGDGSWADLFELIRRLEKTRNLRAESLLLEKA
jgi:hypothetical protein